MSANLAPPPTWTAPVDETTGGFDPVWLQWFISLASVINQTSGSGLSHNSLTGLQGGGTGEEYHLTAAQHALAVLLSTMSSQAASAVAITGGTIDGTSVGSTTPAAGSFSTITIISGTIDGTPIGATTPATGKFSTLTCASITMTGGTINGVTIGATTPAAGTFSTLASASATLTGGTINGTSIGATTPATGKFSTLTNGEAGALIHSSVTLTNAAGASIGTLTNAPAAGNPTKWILIDDDGTLRKMPAW